MDSERRNFGYGVVALLLLCGSYITLGIALVSVVKSWGWWERAPENPLFAAQLLYFTALLLWTFSLYFANEAREKGENKFLVAITCCLAFIPVILAFGYYVVSGVSPLEIVEGLLPSDTGKYIGYA